MAFNHWLALAHIGHGVEMGEKRTQSSGSSLVMAVVSFVLVWGIAAEARAQTLTAASQALVPFHDYDTWEGTVKAGVLWSGSPEVKTVGRARFRWMLDGALLVGDLEQEHYTEGKNLFTWTARYLVGWDASAQQYRVLLIDKNSWGAALVATIQGETFVMMAPPYRSDGNAVVARGIMRVVRDGGVVWSKEISVNGGPWTLTEEFRARRSTPVR
jgi:hypothetical protein